MPLSICLEVIKRTILSPNPSQGGEMDRGGAVVVPWEHWVCSQCLWENPYAVWLIKLRCFQPKRHHHHQYGWTLVSIEPSAMRLVGMRHPPANIEQINAPIPPCQAGRYCQRGDLCPLPHSGVEYHTWEFIRNVFKGKCMGTIIIMHAWLLFSSCPECS